MWRHLRDILEANPGNEDTIQLVDGHILLITSAIARKNRIQPDNRAFVIWVRCVYLVELV